MAAASVNASFCRTNACSGLRDGKSILDKFVAAIVAAIVSLVHSPAFRFLVQLLPRPPRSGRQRQQGPPSTNASVVHCTSSFCRPFSTYNLKAMEHKPPHQAESLETCIRHRHSVRFYKQDPVPDATLHQCLALAQLAPSNSNIQNWRITFARGKGRDRIIAALSAEAQQHAPSGIAPLPEDFKHFRSEMGHELYGEKGYGIARADREKHKWATMRNFSFFDAPVIGVITMNKDLVLVDAMSVGMFVQTFMLALTEQGLGTCLQVSVTGYPELLRREFGLGDDQLILCGIALGWPKEGNAVNDLVMRREDISKDIKILDE